MKEVTIYWATRDWDLIRRIRDKYRLPQYTTVNGLTRAQVNEETLAALRRESPEVLIIRKMTKKP